MVIIKIDYFHLDLYDITISTILPTQSKSTTHDLEVDYFIPYLPITFVIYKKITLLLHHTL